MQRAANERARRAAALTILGIAAAAATAVVGVLAIGTEAGQRADNAALGGVSPWTKPEAYDATNRFLDTIGVASLALLGAAIVLVALLRGRPRLAVTAGIVLLGANLTTQAVKGLVDRPDLVDDQWSGHGSFPSGHATVAMSLAMALVLVVPRSLRWTAAVGGCAYAAGVGVAVIAIDWHRPSEVLGAYLVVVAWTALATAGLVLVGEDAPREAGRAGRAGAIVAGGLAAAFGLVVAVQALSRVDIQAFVDDRTSFAVAAAACALACAALGAATTALMQRASTSSAPRSAASLPRDARRHPHRRG